MTAPPLWPHWGDEAALRSLLAGRVGPKRRLGAAIETAGRILRSPSVSAELRRKARAALHRQALEYLAAMEPLWEARCEELLELCDALPDTPASAAALAVCWLRDDLESVQHAMAVAELAHHGNPDFADLDTLVVDMRRWLDWFDRRVEPIVPRLCRPLLTASQPPSPELAASLAALRALASTDDGAWWLEAVDPSLLAAASALTTCPIDGTQGHVAIRYIVSAADDADDAALAAD